ncbi:MAG: tetratricopeptide repeat protein [Rhodanobacteraceae bacterium]
MSAQTTFFTELKRRHVGRAAIVYAAAVWALAQGISQLSPAFGLATGVTLWFVIACVIGFPFWVAFAWYFKFTSHGIERESDTLEDAAAIRRSGRKLDYWIIGILAIAVVLLLTNQLVLQRGKTLHEFTAAPTSSAATAAIPAKSIAVLPFENLSNDKDNAYFVAGMQDLILTKLADIGDLKVIARTSTEKYQSHPDDLNKIAQQLGVATILEGSVQKSGKEVLINVQLIDAKTDAHIWAESYTRTLDNIFGMEGEVADKVAKALNAKLTQAEAARVAAIPTTNRAAYDAYLRGEYHMAAFNRGEMKPDVSAAVREYSEAIRQDPEFALAWARLANAQIFLEEMTYDDPSLVTKLRTQAKASIAKALALQPDLAEAHVSQGIYDLFASGDWHAALAAFAKAHALQPQNARVTWFTGYTLRGLGDVRGSVRAFREAQILDPERPPGELASDEMYLHHFAQARQLWQRALSINPDSWVALDSLARLYAYLGDLKSMGTLIESAPPNVKANPNFTDTLGDYFIYRRDWAAARKLYAQAKEPQNLHAAFYPIEIPRGDVEWYAGDKAAAREQYQRAIPLIAAMLKLQPKNPQWHAELGWVYARIGRDAEALEEGRLALGAPDPTAGVIRHSPDGALALARIQAQVGQAGQAVAILDKLLAKHTGTLVSVPLLKMDPTWDPIRNDPRFQALLKKYADALPAVATSAGTATRQESSSVAH